MIGIYATLPPGPHTHQNPAQGGQLNPDLALNPFPKVDFGDGADGNVVVATGITLTRDMRYNNLTINNPGSINCLGYKIKVKGKLTIGALAYVYENSNPQGSPGAAGVGGAGGITSNVRRPFASLPTSGAKGGDGLAVGVNVANGGTAPALDLPNASLLSMGFFWQGGGGAGGGGQGNAPQVGANPLPIQFGARGGNGAVSKHTAGNTIKGGGGGGSGRGLIEIWANEIDNGGAITSDGGAGGDGESPGAGNEGGGGGGGGGGAILIFYKIASGAGLGLIRANGGAAGAGGGAGATAGEAGYIYTMQIGP